MLIKLYKKVTSTPYILMYFCPVVLSFMSNLGPWNRKVSGSNLAGNTQIDAALPMRVN